MSKIIFQLKLTLKVLLLLGSVSLLAADAAEGVKMDLSKAEQQEADRIAIRTSKKLAEGGVNPLTAFADDEIFLDIEGIDQIKWGTFRKFVEAKLLKFPLRPEWDEATRRAARGVSAQQIMSKTLKNYLLTAVIGVKARKLGVKVDIGEFDRRRAESRAAYETQGEVGSALLKQMAEPGSFYEHNLTNVVYYMAYAEQIARPALAISAEDIASRQAIQDERIRHIVSTNAFKHNQIYQIRSRLLSSSWRKDHLDFAEAARLFSDDNNSDEGGLFTDADEKPQEIKAGDLHPLLEKACASLKEGEITEVVETPYSWNILKLIKFTPATETDVETRQLAQIMLEKEPMLPVLTVEQARAKIANALLKTTLSAEAGELMKTMKIESKIPLFGKESMSRVRKFK